MFKINLRDIKISDSIDWDLLVNKTKGYSGADIALVCREAAFMPMRKKLYKGGFNFDSEKLAELEEQIDVPLEMEDFEEAIKATTRTVNAEVIQRYETWMEEFGCT